MLMTLPGFICVSYFCVSLVYAFLYTTFGKYIYTMCIMRLRMVQASSAGSDFNINDTQIDLSKYTYIHC